MPTFFRLAVSSLFAAAVFLTVPAASAADLMPAPTMGEDGLHKPSWLKVSFLDLNEDVTDAAAQGKRLFMTVEWKGCPYCTKMNEVNFRDPQIVAYLTKHFDHIQLNLDGAREVTDFNGDAMAEKEYVRRLHQRGTPKLVFFLDPDKAKGKRGLDAVALTVEGYWGREQFYRMMEYVVTKAYEKEPNFLVWLNSDAPKEKVSFD